MKGYRTIIFNAVTLLVMVAGAVLQYVGQLGITDAQAALVGLAATLMVNIGNMYLRSVTTTPLGKP
jgi:Flp pilus assembly protein protease CpaA